MVPLAISIQEVFSILKRGNALPPEGLLLASAPTKYPEVPARQRWPLLRHSCASPCCVTAGGYLTYLNLSLLICEMGTATNCEKGHEVHNKSMSGGPRGFMPAAPDVR